MADGPDGTPGRHSRTTRRRAERADDSLAHHSAHGHRGTHRHHRGRLAGRAVRSAGAIANSRYSGTMHHGPGAPGRLERHETPDPVRSGAVKAGFQCVRRASGSEPIS